MSARTATTPRVLSGFAYISTAVDLLSESVSGRMEAAQVNGDHSPLILRHLADQDTMLAAQELLDMANSLEDAISRVVLAADEQEIRQAIRFARSEIN